MKSIQRITATILATSFLVGSFSGAKALENQTPSSAGAMYYVAGNGTGTSCSSSAPCAFSTGLNKVGPGDTLGLVGAFAGPLVISKSGTATARINIIGGRIAAAPSPQEAVLVSGSYLNISSMNISGGWEFGMRVQGHDIKLASVYVHDSVMENRNGSACLNNASGSWGRGLTFAPSSYNIEVAGGAVYNNCGEGIGFTQNRNSFIHGTKVYDNYSRNIYIGNATGTRVEGVTSYYSNPNFYRDGEPGRCIGLAIEQSAYTTYGNMMRDTTIRGNTLTDCKGINFYSEVADQFPTNVLVENNTFVSVPFPQVKIPGTNVIVRNNTGITSTSSTTSSTAKTYDDQYIGFVYSAGWISVSNPLVYNGSYHETSTNGSKVNFKFPGTKFTVIYKGGPYFRKMNVFLDGTQIGTIDQQRDSGLTNLKWNSPEYPYATHTLTLVFVTDSPNTKGSLDAVTIR